MGRWSRDQEECSYHGDSLLVVYALGPRCGPQAPVAIWPGNGCV